jgi:hypothetical protein
MYSRTFCFYTSLALLLVGISSLWVDAFVPGGAAFRPKPQRTHHAASRKSSLEFIGDMVETSDPLDNVSRENAVRFLQSNRFLELLLSGGGKRAVTAVERTPELEEMWQNAYDNLEMKCQPQEIDSLLATDTVIQFPGLKLTNTVVNGVKKFEKEDCVECILVAEKRTPSGAPPLVWMFNQLTGGSAQANFTPPQGHALSQMSVVEKGEGELAYETDVKITIVINIPAAVIRLLPASHEKMEAQGSEAIKNSVAKDVMPALAAVRKACMEEMAASFDI